MKWARLAPAHELNLQIQVVRILSQTDEPMRSLAARPRLLIGHGTASVR